MGSSTLYVMMAKTASIQNLNWGSSFAPKSLNEKWGGGSSLDTHQALNQF